MRKSGWWVAGISVAFFIIQSCGGDEFTGRIVGPAGTLEGSPTVTNSQQAECDGGACETQSP